MNRRSFLQGLALTPLVGIIPLSAKPTYIRSLKVSPNAYPTGAINSFPMTATEVIARHEEFAKSAGEALARKIDSDIFNMLKLAT